MDAADEWRALDEVIPNVQSSRIASSMGCVRFGYVFNEHTYEFMHFFPLSQFFFGSPSDTSTTAGCSIHIRFAPSAHHFPKNVLSTSSHSERTYTASLANISCVRWHYIRCPPTQIFRCLYFVCCDKL